MSDQGARLHFVDHDGTEIPATFERWEPNGLPGDASTGVLHDDYAWLVVDGPNSRHYLVAAFSESRLPGTWHRAKIEVGKENE